MIGLDKPVFVHTTDWNGLNDIIIKYDGLELVDMGHNIYNVADIEYLTFENAIECLCELRNEGFKPTDKYVSLFGDKLRRGL